MNNTPAVAVEMTSVPLPQQVVEEKRTSFIGKIKEHPLVKSLDQKRTAIISQMLISLVVIILSFTQLIRGEEKTIYISLLTYIIGWYSPSSLQMKK